MINVRSLEARFTLLFAVIKKVIVNLFVRRRGARRWMARLAEEELARTPAANWEVADHTSRCIGCGLCDVVDGDTGTETVSGWLMGAARRPQDAGLALAHVPEVRAHAAAIAAVCPARVPVEEIAALIERNAAALAHIDEGLP